MKRSTKQLLSLLLAIVMVLGLMAPALATASETDDVPEIPVLDEQFPETSDVVDIDDIVDIDEEEAVLLATEWHGAITGNTWTVGDIANDTVVEVGDIATVGGVTLHIDDESKITGPAPSVADVFDHGVVATNQSSAKFSFVVGDDAVGKTLKIYAKMAGSKAMHIAFNGTDLAADKFSLSSELAGYTFGGTSNGSDIDTGYLTVPNLEKGTYTFWGQGSKARLYSFEVKANSAPASWVPSGANGDAVEAGELATVGGVTLSVEASVLTGVAGSVVGTFEVGITPSASSGKFTFVVGDDAVGKTLKIYAKMAKNKAMHIAFNDTDLAADKFSLSSELAGYTFGGTENGSSDIDNGYLTVPNLEKGAYTFWGQGSKARLYSFSVAEAGAEEPEVEDLTNGIIIDQTWYAPAAVPEAFNASTGAEVATVAGVKLSLLPEAGWKYSGGNANCAKAGYMYGLVANNNTDATDADGSRVPTKAAFKFEVGSDVPADTTLTIVFKQAKNKKFFVVDGDGAKVAGGDLTEKNINTSENTPNTSDVNPQTATFPVEAGKTYYFYGVGTKPALYAYTVSGGTAGKTKTYVAPEKLTVVQAGDAASATVMTNLADGVVYAAAANNKVTVEVDGKAVKVTPGEADSAVGTVKVWVIADAAGKASSYDTATKIQTAGGKSITVTVEAKPIENTDPTVWLASKDNVPGNGAKLEQETNVPLTGKINGADYTVDGVKLYVGSDAGYKFATATDMGDSSGNQPHIVGQDNPQVGAEDPKTGEIKYTGAKGAVPERGCYYKFVAEKDGVLQTETVLNAAKDYYVLLDEEEYSHLTVGVKSLKKEVVPMSAGSVCYIYCEASKLGLKSVQYNVGATKTTNAAWNMNTICGGAIKVTPTADSKNGVINVKVEGPRVGVDVDATTTPITLISYAEELEVEMYNGDGELVGRSTSIAAGSVHDYTLTPTASGKYTFKAIAKNAEQDTTLDSAMSSAVDFVLPMGKPVASVSILDGGKLGVNWAKVPEATGYNVYMADSADGLKTATAIEVETNSYTTDALTVGTTYYFQVEAVRGSDKGAKSETAQGTAAADAKVLWDETYYGTSTTKWSDSEQKGNDSTLTTVYPDRVIPADKAEQKPFQIRSWGGSGKVQEGDQDGVMFVYTRIPGDKNFTLRGKVTVEKWRYEGQEGMGLMATDALGAGNDLDKKDQNSVFVNNYMVGAMRFGNGSLGATFGKAFKGNKGIGMIQEVGNPNPSVKPASWDYKQINLDPYPEEKGMTSGTYNILGKEVVKEGETILGTVKAGFTQADTMVETLDLEIERNNTGIYARYYLPNGDVRVAKTYNRDALLQQDDSAMYVGFFASRHMVINVTDVSLRVDDPEKYDPPEVPDTTYITPRINVGSPLISNSESYKMILTSNVVGTATVTTGDTTKTVQLVKQREDDKSTGATRYVTRADLEMPVKNGTNQIQVAFQPAAKEDQGLAPYYELLNNDVVKTTVSVTYQNKFAGRNNLYVSPKGSTGGFGTKERPLDLYTAVKVAQPGQKVILMEGTYGLTTTLTIEKGINGTQDKPIYLMADPEAATRPVLDGTRLSTSSGIALKGDYWHFYNFVVQNCGGSGIAVNGNNNVIEYVDTIGNQNTGLQIARGGEVDGVLKFWPSNNLILNCLSMNNRDSSWGSADGFASKLTSGTGNVFRYCVAAYNADDGWDLFAKSEDGPIGDVIIENCVVYKSGFGLDANGKEITDDNANGNGFKMGGSGVYGNHKVYNSYSFYNKAKGVDSNSGPNTEAHNVVSFNNIGPNIRFYTDSNVENTDYAVDNFISFKNDEMKDENYVNESKTTVSYSTFDEMVTKGTQRKSKWNNPTAYYWKATGTKSSTGKIADPASLFVSTDLKDLAIGYNEDGNLCTGDFLKLKSDIPANLASVVPSTDPAKYHNPENLMVMADNLSDPYCITPDAAFVVANNSSGGSRDDRGDSGDSTAANRVNKRTNSNGDLVITVTAPNGDVLVDVTLPATLPTTDKKFADVPDDHWAANAIYEMAARSIVKGVDDENFDMNSAVTRGTLATMLFRLSNGKEGYENAFSDVKEDSWYKDAVAWAAKTGVVNGYGDGTFGGDATITREQLALMLYRYAGLLGMDTTVTGDTSAFTDSTSVSSWAADAMSWAVANGIINGVGDNTLAPGASATRAQTALMLQRFIALVK